MREQFARRADIYVALPVEDEVGAAEGAVGACRLIPHRNVRCDLAIHQPLEQPGGAIDGVACEPLGLQIEAAADPVHHGLGNGDLNHAIGSRALGVDDDPDFVVDEIVCIIGKEGVNARPGNPCRLGIGQRDFLGRLAAAAARSATIPVIIVFATAGGIECREILADCMGCFLGLRPGNRLVAWNSLPLVDIRLDQARINREGFAADQAGRNALRHHTLEHPA